MEIFDIGSPYKPNQGIWSVLGSFFQGFNPSQFFFKLYSCLDLVGDGRVMDSQVIQGLICLFLRDNSPLPIPPVNQVEINNQNINQI